MLAVNKRLKAQLARPKTSGSPIKSLQRIRVRRVWGMGNTRRPCSLSPQLVLPSHLSKCLMKCSPSTLPQTTHLFLQNHLPLLFNFQRLLLPGLSSPFPMAQPLDLLVYKPTILRRQCFVLLLTEPIMLCTVSRSWLTSSVLALLQEVSFPISVVPLFCVVRRRMVGPIAIGEVLRWLTSKCAARSAQSEALGILAPLQLGVGIPARCEAIVDAVSNVLEDSNVPPDNCFILLVDFSNAFKSVDRSTLFREVRHRIPSIAAWMEYCYGAQPILHLADHTILCCCGVQQGDPIGPLGFALALQPTVGRGGA